MIRKAHSRALSRCDHRQYESAEARVSEIDRDGLRELYARRMAAAKAEILRAVYEAARELKVGVGGPSDAFPQAGTDGQQLFVDSRGGRQSSSQGLRCRMATTRM